VRLYSHHARASLQLQAALPASVASRGNLEAAVDKFVTAAQATHRVPPALTPASTGGSAFSRSTGASGASGAASSYTTSKQSSSIYSGSGASFQLDSPPASEPPRRARSASDEQFDAAVQEHFGSIAVGEETPAIVDAFCGDFEVLNLYQGTCAYAALVKLAPRLGGLSGGAFKSLKAMITGYIRGAKAPQH
jgi:hypothetical protein